MEDIIQMLKMKDVTKSAMSEYSRLSKANLIIMDDIMLFPFDKSIAVALFNFINQLYEKTSLLSQLINRPKNGLLCLMMKCWRRHFLTESYISVKL